MVAPTPFKTVRRGTCFLDMNMWRLLIYLLALNYARALHRLRLGGTRRILN